MHHFGKRLRRLRADRPQKEVATALDIPQTTLSALENQAAVPRGEVVEKLASYYGVSVSYFYPTEPMAVSDKAKTWLESLAETKVQTTSIATHATLPIDDSVKKMIAERIQRERAKRTHKSKERR